MSGVVPFMIYVDAPLLKCTSHIITQHSYVLINKCFSEEIFPKKKHQNYWLIEINLKIVNQ